MTQTQSWKCPKCIEDDLIRRRKAFKPIQLATSPFGRKPSKLTVPPKKAISKKYIEDSESSSSESESESESDTDSDFQKKPVKKIVLTKKSPAKKKKKVVSESSEEESDSSSDDDHDSPAKIIRTPIDKSEFHKYGLK